MTLTWHDETQPPLRSSGGLPLRLASMGLAALVCATLVYLAVNQRFGVIAAFFPERDAIDAIVERPVEPPPAPPLVVRNESPPPQQAALNPDAPPTFTPDLFAIDNAPPTPPSPFITNATFIARPSGRDFERYFPERALARGESGRVVLDCTIGADGRVACVVESETPSGWGFGEASLRAARHFRVAPATSDGRATSGGRLRVPMTWRTQ